MVFSHQAFAEFQSLQIQKFSFAVAVLKIVKFSQIVQAGYGIWMVFSKQALSQFQDSQIPGFSFTVTPGRVTPGRIVEICQIVKAGFYSGVGVAKTGLSDGQALLKKRLCSLI